MASGVTGGSPMDRGTGVYTLADGEDPDPPAVASSAAVAVSGRDDDGDSSAGDPSASSSGTPVIPARAFLKNVDTTRATFDEIFTSRATRGENFARTCASFFQTFQKITYIDCSGSKITDTQLASILDNWKNAKDPSKKCSLNIEECPNLTGKSLAETGKTTVGTPLEGGVSPVYAGITELYFLRENTWIDDATPDQMRCVVPFLELKNKPTEVMLLGEINNWVGMLQVAGIEYREALQILFEKYPVPQVQFYYSEVRSPTLIAVLQIHKGLKRLDLEGSKIVYPDGEENTNPFRILLEEGQHLVAIKVRDTDWMGEWIDSEVMLKRANQSGPSSLPADPFPGILTEFKPLIAKISYKLQSSDGTQCSFDEIVDWTEHILCTGLEALERPAAVFFTRFPNIDTIVCADQKDELGWGVGTFRVGGAHGRKVLDQYLENLIKAIAYLPEGRKFTLDLRDCATLSPQTIDLIVQNKARFNNVLFAAQPWLEQATAAQTGQIKDFFALDPVPTETLTMEQFISWRGMYSDQAPLEDVFRDLAAKYPDVTSLDFQGADISRAYFEKIVGAFADRVTAIDIRGCPNLGTEPPISKALVDDVDGEDDQLTGTVLQSLIACRALKTIYVNQQDSWIREVWDLPGADYTALEGVLLKIDFSFSTEAGAVSGRDVEEAGPATTKEVIYRKCALNEIFEWNRLLFGEMGTFDDRGRRNFEKTTELFFRRFPDIEEIDCSGCATSDAQIEVVINRWPRGKDATARSGTLNLRSLIGCTNGVFGFVKDRLPHLNRLYVDERDGYFTSALIHKADPTHIEGLKRYIALENGPENHTFTYEHLKRWEKLIVTPGSGFSIGQFAHCCSDFFKRYKEDNLSIFDFRGANITDLELNHILDEYRKVHPDQKITLLLDRCPNLTTLSFQYIAKHCGGVTLRLDRLSIENNSSMINKLTKAAVDPFWSVLTLSEPIEDSCTFAQLKHWHVLMGKGAEWNEACRRFFERFPNIVSLDLSDSAITPEELRSITNSWNTHLGPTKRTTWNLRSCKALTSASVRANLTTQSVYIKALYLDGNYWPTDDLLWEVLNYLHLEEVSLGGCRNISHVMLGVCEPILASPSQKVDTSEMGALVQEGPKEIVSTVSYKELAAFFSDGTPKQHKGRCKQYFLHHPKIQRLNFSRTALDNDRLGVILSAFRAAKDEWAAADRKASVIADRADWIEQAREVTLLLDNCPNLDARIFPVIAENLHELNGLSVAENRWVVNSGLEEIDRMLIELTRKKIDEAERRFADGGKTIGTLQAEIARAEGIISRHEEGYRVVHPIKGVLSPDERTARAAAMKSYVIRNGGNYDLLATNKEALSTLKSKFYNTREYYQLVSFRIPAQVYGCRNLSFDVAPRLQYVSLADPHWKTPIREDHAVTFSQIEHLAAGGSTPKERVLSVFTLFQAFQKQIWKEVSTSFNLTGASISPEQFNTCRRYLLPYQEEAVSSALRDQAVQSSSDVEQVTQAMVLQISTTLANLEKRATPVAPPSSAQAGAEQTSEPNFDTLFLSLDGANFDDDCADLFSELERAVEQCFFLLNLTENPQVTTLRETLSESLIKTYTTLFTKENWELDSRFVQRMAIAYQWPLVQPNPSAGGDEGVEFRLDRWFERVDYDQQMGVRGDCVRDWMNNFLSRLECLIEGLSLSEEQKSKGERITKDALTRMKNQWVHATQASTMQREAKDLSFPSVGEMELEAEIATIRASAEATLEILRNKWAVQQELLFSTESTGTMLAQHRETVALNLGRSAVTLWQLEGILKHWASYLSVRSSDEGLLEKAGSEINVSGVRYLIDAQTEGEGSEQKQYPVLRKRDASLDLSYTPHLTGKSVVDVFKRLDLSLSRMNFDGNLWVDNRFVQAASSRSEMIGIESCVNYKNGKRTSSGSDGGEAQIDVGTSDYIFVDLDDDSTSRTFHISKIRKLLAAVPGDIGARFDRVMDEQATKITHVSFTNSDVSDQEFSFLVRGMKHALKSVENPIVVLDLSRCSSLTSAVTGALAHLKGKISSLDFSFNRWLDLRSLNNLVANCNGLAELSLVDCPNLLPEQLDHFLDDFFKQRQADILERLELSHIEPGAIEQIKILKTKAKKDIDTDLHQYWEIAQRIDISKIEEYERECIALSLSMCTEFLGEKPLKISVRPGEKYSEKLAKEREDLVMKMQAGRMAPGMPLAGGQKV